MDFLQHAQSVEKVEGKRRDEEERKQREIDAKRMRKMKEKNLPKAIEIINRMNASQLNF